MKNLPLALLLLISSSCIGQESFKKSYFLPRKDTSLKIETFTKFENLSKVQQDSIRNFYKKASNITYTMLKGTEKVMVNITDQNFYKTQGIKKSTPVDVNVNGKRIKAMVKFEEDKIIVNRYLIGNRKEGFKDGELAYYELKNREAKRLQFLEFNVNTLTIPIKYRFKNSALGLQEEFTTGINLNLLGGLSFGETKFLHQEKVGNITNTWKLTTGFIFGASTVKLNNANTSLAFSPIPLGTEITKGLASFGLGTAYSFNKINFGAFYGWDYSIGVDSKKWDYNRKPWLGLAIGYSLFAF